MRKLAIVLLGMLSFASISIAHPTDVFEGRWSVLSLRTLTVAYGTGLSSYSYLIDTGSRRWNDVNSNISIKSANYNVNADNDFPALINFRSVDLGPLGAWADALNYKYNFILGYVADWTSNDWAVSRIRINTNSTTGGNGFSNLDTNLKYKIITHEVGHSLGLAHPLDHGQKAIMKQGDNGYYVIQQHDIDVLSSKY